MYVCIYVYMNMIPICDHRIFATQVHAWFGGNVLLRVLGCSVRFCGGLRVPSIVVARGSHSSLLDFSVDLSWESL